MRIIPGVAAMAALFALTLPAPAADRVANGVRPARDAAPAVVTQRRVVRPRTTTRRYWRRTAGPYWGPYYQPWPSYGTYPHLYRPHYGWGPPMRGFSGGYTW